MSRAILKLHYFDILRKEISFKFCLRKCNSTGDQDCDPDCTEKDTTKGIKQNINVTNGQTKGMTKKFNVTCINSNLRFGLELNFLRLQCFSLKIVREIRVPTLVATDRSC